MPIDKITVEKDGKKQDVFIAMTPEEANDRSYRSYLKEAEAEKTAGQLAKKPAREESKLTKEEQVEAIKQMKEYRDKVKVRSVKSRYFSGNYTS